MRRSARKAGRLGARKGWPRLARREVKGGAAEQPLCLTCLAYSIQPGSCFERPFAVECLYNVEMEMGHA